MHSDVITMYVSKYSIPQFICSIAQTPQRISNHLNSKKSYRTLPEWFRNANRACWWRLYSHSTSAPVPYMRLARTQLCLAVRCRSNSLCCSVMRASASYIVFYVRGSFHRPVTLAEVSWAPQLDTHNINHTAEWYRRVLKTLSRVHHLAVEAASPDAASSENCSVQAFNDVMSWAQCIRPVTPCTPPIVLPDAWWNSMKHWFLQVQLITYSILPGT